MPSVLTHQSAENQCTPFHKDNNSCLNLLNTDHYKKIMDHFSGQIRDHDERIWFLRNLNEKNTMKTLELNCTVENMTAFGNNVLEPWRMDVSNHVNNILYGARELEVRVNSSLEGWCELERRVNILADEVICLKSENQRLKEETESLKSRSINPNAIELLQNLENQLKSLECRRVSAGDKEEFLLVVEKLIDSKVSKSSGSMEMIERRMSELERKMNEVSKSTYKTEIMEKKLKELERKVMHQVDVNQGNPLEGRYTKRNVSLNLRRSLGKIQIPESAPEKLFSNKNDKKILCETMNEDRKPIIGDVNANKVPKLKDKEVKSKKKKKSKTEVGTEKIIDAAHNLSQTKENVTPERNSSSSERGTRQGMSKPKLCWYDSECRRKNCSFQHSFPIAKKGGGFNGKYNIDGNRASTSFEPKVQREPYSAQCPSTITLGNGTGNSFGHLFKALQFLSKLCGEPSTVNQ